MAEKELSILVRARGALQAARDIGKVDTAVGRLGSTASRGVRTAARNAAIVGAGLAVGIGFAARSGIESLADLEDAITSTQGAIDNAGIGAQVSAQQIATWANELESSIDAAFDDKAITSATGTLIRFGKLTPENIRPAMEVMTDLAAKTGDVDSAAGLLAKALADPTKAAGKLAKHSVILTAQQQKQIKAMVKAGDTAGAQAVLIAALAETTEGAADAMAGPYRDSLNTMAAVTEDAQRALGEGFLPVLQEVRDILGEAIANPQTMASIREFGQGIAGGLRSLVEIGKNLPWEAIGTSLKVAGTGARAILDAFTGLPPWVQTAVITGWGLNKLTGGALGDIVGELGKGLIKGVLGMNAGVVNIKAGVVNGGGFPGGGGKGGPVPGGIGAAGAGVLTVGLTAGAAALIGGAVGNVMLEQIPRLATKVFGTAGGDERGPLKNQLAPEGSRSPITGYLEAQTAALTRNVPAKQEATTTAVEGTTSAVKSVETAQGATTRAVGTVERTAAVGLMTTARASTLAGVLGATATAVSASRIVAAIAANRPQVTVNNHVSTTEITKTTTNRDRSGGGTSSGGGGLRDSQRGGRWGP